MPLGGGNCPRPPARPFYKEQSMRKMPAVAMIVLTALAVGSASPLLLNAQNASVGTGASGAAAGNDDMPHRTARAFAPFLRAIIQRRISTAQQIFKVRRNVSNMLDQPWGSEDGLKGRRDYKWLCNDGVDGGAEGFDDDGGGAGGAAVFAEAATGADIFADADAAGFGMDEEGGQGSAASFRVAIDGA